MKRPPLARSTLGALHVRSGNLKNDDPLQPLQIVARGRKLRKPHVNSKNPGSPHREIFVFNADKESQGARFGIGRGFYI